MQGLPEGYSDRSVCVFGLGYVGLTLATVMAEVGFRVTGVEIRDEVLATLMRGSAHFYEPRLDARLKVQVERGALRFIQHIASDTDASVYINTVGTPLGSDGRVQLAAVRNVTREIAGALESGDMVIMRSTVRPGVTRNLVKPILDEVGVDYDLVFCPERTIEGRALEELRRLPQIVGGRDLRARVRAAQLFQHITPTVVQVSDLETAEMIKLMDNASRDVCFALSNELARMSEALGISAMEVIEAGKLGYPRTDLALPGPVGGPCLEKDSYILAEGMEPFGLVPEIIMAARRVNERQPAEAVARIAAHFERHGGTPADMRITLAGLAFKGRPATDDLRGTMALPILAALRRAFPGATFRGYDPMVTAEAIRETFALEPISGLDAAFEAAHLVVIANNHPAFADMPIGGLSKRMARPAAIYDFWNNFDGRDLGLAEDVCYLALGVVDRPGAGAP